MKLYLKIFLTATVLAFVLPVVAMSQSRNIEWRSNVRMITPTEGEVIVKAIVAPGWHLYGTELPNGGPKPTVIDLSASRGVKFTTNLTPGVAPTVKQDKMFNLKLSYWGSDVTFRRRFKVTDAKNARIEGTVTYMGCNDATCLPPATFKISKPVPVKK
ncbi:MAG: protein-disulfide reductase DsbD N-terminal domain-containing protein [Firmicutes bacterium]|nr:protein-disulfide reductase DsbD N-terminal domain-containing protein [Bacillota bacterium]MCM1401999.1 protein-disulfide reductase DsbD N-terminal domain-containing protein [Bacteroides sp.]MCM1476896.1 protein-disulfide reductase DsbD N-terminal domain-containing protein [Bacteroides sp.]